MKAAYHTAKHEITLKEIDKPTVKFGECLVQVKSCSICGSDTWWNHDAAENEPVHGHETAGVVIEVGEGVTKYSVGDRVACYAIQSCGKCVCCERGEPTYCESKGFIEGGFQEYVAMPEEMLFALPEELDFVAASLVTDAIGVPLRGLRRLAPERNDTVCVWGLGPLGLLQVMFLKATGVKTIIGVDMENSRLEKAKELGADFVLNPKDVENVPAKVVELTNGGADKAYLYVRHPKVTADVFAATRGGGSICTFVGLEGHYELQEYHERALVWSFYFTPNEYEPNLEFVKTHGIDLKAVVSDVFSLSDINEAFRKRFEKPDESLKIVISMD